MIELKNVSKRYTTTTFGVRDLNFEIRDQEFLVIYGPSGAGKSTTLKLLAGIIKPTSGEIDARWSIVIRRGSRKPRYGHGV